MAERREVDEEARENVIINCMKGVAKSTGFGICPSGGVGITYNQQLDQFIISNLKNGEQSTLNKDALVSVKKVARWEGMHVVERRSRCIVLMLAVEKRTEKTYLISFTEDKIGLRMKALDELYLGVLDPQDAKEGSKKTSYIGEDHSGAIYCFTTWLDFNHTTNKPTFHAVKVTVGSDGKLEAKVVFDARSVQGAHLKLPLVDRNAIYMLPVHNQYDEEKIVKLPLSSPSHPKIIHAKYGPNGMPPFFCPWSHPIHVSEHTALFYAYGLVDDHLVGQFWTLTLPEGEWRKLDFELHDHAIKDNISILQDPNDKALLLHGDCADENCAEKAHIYRLNFNTILPAAKHSGLAVPSTQTISCKTKKRKLNGMHESASVDSKKTTKAKSSRPAKKAKVAKTQVTTSGPLTRSKSRR